MFRRLLGVGVLVFAAGSVRAQFMDSGGEKGAIFSAQVAADPAPEEGGDLSRSLLQLKEQRSAVVARFGANSSLLGPIDQKIAALRGQMVAAHVAPAALASSIANDFVPAAQNFPRIVQSTPYVATPVAVNSGTAVEVATVAHSYTGDSAVDRATRAQFSQAAVSLNAEAIGVEKCIDAIRVQSHCNITVNWKALEGAGIDRNTTVTTTLVNVSAAHVLDTVLHVVGGGTANLDYTIDDGVIAVSTRDDLNSTKYQTVRMYNVSDLIALPAGLPYSPAALAQIREQRSGAVCGAITSIIAPDTWRDNGGTIGSIREFDGVLIINQTNENHRLIEQFLAQFRATRGPLN